MRIAYVITRADTIGGAHVHVAELASALRDDGHDTVVIVGGDGPYLDMLADHRLRVVRVDRLVQPVRPVTDATAVIELRRVLRTEDPDLVSTHSSKAGIVGRVAARSLRLPVLFTAHGWAFAPGVPPARRAVFTLAELAVGRLADRVITVSRYDEKLARSYCIVPRSRLVMIHNGVRDTTSDLRAKPERDAARLLMVARFDHQKDHDTLLSALACLRREWGGLDLVGNGPTEARLHALVRQLGLSDRVTFHPFGTNVAQLMSEVQLYVLSSRWEGLPRTIIEAMRSGLPVVASDVGGVRELVDHGRTGMLVPPGDVTSLRSALDGLLDDGSCRVAFGRAGRAAFEQRFTFERMLTETVGEYADILRHRAPT